MLAETGFIGLTINGMDGKSGLREWEGVIPWLYLDSRRLYGVLAPLVTVGIGCALGSYTDRVPPAEVQALPWMVNGESATAEMIAHDYEAVCSSAGAMMADSYEHLSSIRLSDASMVALCETRLATFVTALQKTFPEFDGWPVTCKAGALDLIYGTGISGFRQYYLFIAACLSGHWKAAALQSASDANLQAYDKRNQARRVLFLDAA